MAHGRRKAGLELRGGTRLKGDALTNEFQGKAGKDTMTGGGRDTWDFNDVADSPAGTTRDLVADFAPGGQDVLDLFGIDADETMPGNQSFRWVGKATLTGAAQLGYYVSGGDTIILASNDADAAAEVEIRLTGAKTLTEGDFCF